MARKASLTTEVASGDRRRGLEALRDRLAEEVEREVASGFCESCKRGSSIVPSLSKQLADVIAQLATIPVPMEGTPLDELERRRKQNRKTGVSPSTVRGGRTAGR